MRAPLTICHCWGLGIALGEGFNARASGHATSLTVYPRRQIRLTETKAKTPIRKDAMPTATLHSGLFNSKSTTEPATKLPIHAHQAANSALPNFMGTNILGRVCDDEHHTVAVARR